MGCTLARRATLSNPITYRHTESSQSWEARRGWPYTHRTQTPRALQACDAQLRFDLLYVDHRIRTYRVLAIMGCALAPLCVEEMSRISRSPLAPMIRLGRIGCERTGASRGQPRERVGEGASRVCHGEEAPPYRMDSPAQRRARPYGHKTCTPSRAAMLRHRHRRDSTSGG
jgi:hypothetical protein